MMRRRQNNSDRRKNTICGTGVSPVSQWERCPCQKVLWGDLSLKHPNCILSFVRLARPQTSRIGSFVFGARIILR